MVRMGFVLMPHKKVPLWLAILILVLNVVAPGVGTLVYGRIGRGIAELLLFWTFILWIMSITDGVQVLTKAVDRPEAAPVEAPKAPKK